jgi:flagellar protein FlbB
MARFGRSPVIGRVIVLLILIIAMSLGGLLWFDYLGLLDAKNLFAPLFALTGLKPRQATSVPTDYAGLLDDDRLVKQNRAIVLRNEELDKKEEDLSQKDKEFAQQVAELDDRQKSLDEQEKSFNEKQKAIENKKANVDQNAQYLAGMPPDKAVAILTAMDDQDVIDILRTVESQAAQEGTQSIVPYWLSLMPADRAATVQRKMSNKPTSLQ